MSESPDIQIYGSNGVITNENRKNSEILRITRFTNVEIWVNDKLVYSTEQ